MVQPSHPYMNTGKTIALTRQTFAGKVISLLFNMLSRLLISFLPRSKCLLRGQYHGENSRRGGLSRSHLLEKSMYLALTIREGY